MPYFPEEDEKLRAKSVSRRRGGNCPNSLEVLQQLMEFGHSPKTLALNLVAVLPARISTASREIRDSFGSRVRIDRCIYREDVHEPASSYIIRSLATGSRTIVNYNELPEMTFDEFMQVADSFAGDVTWYHFEGRIPAVTLKCILYLRKRYPSIKISVEIEKPGRSGLQELALNADVVFYSKSWAQGQGYKSAEECVQKQADLTRNASILCCTWGEYGAVIYECATKSLTHSPAYIKAQSQIIDSIGAGDTFIATMLYSIIQHSDDWSIPRKADFANRAAGTKVAQEGFSKIGEALQKYI